MSKDVDPKIMAKALRFLATGFEMASESGVSARLERVDAGADPSPYAAGLPKDVRVNCTSDYLHIGLFSARLPVDFLVQSIGRGASEITLHERAGWVQARAGLAEFDGAERYAMSRVHVAYSDVRGGFAMAVTMQLGDPVTNTFVYAAAIDRSSEMYRVSFEVAFGDLFRFVFPVTKAEAEALISCISERRGIEVPHPPFYVSK